MLNRTTSGHVNVRPDTETNIVGINWHKSSSSFQVRCFYKASSGKVISIPGGYYKDRSEAVLARHLLEAATMPEDRVSKSTAFKYLFGSSDYEN